MATQQHHVPRLASQQHIATSGIAATRCHVCRLADVVKQQHHEQKTRWLSRWYILEDNTKLWTIMLGIRFGKSTHISMISNSVTHLRSYTNSAIADIAGNSAPISPVTPRDRRRRLAEQRRLRIERRRLCIDRRYRRIEWPPRNRRRRCPKRRRLHIERRYRRIEWRLFHDLSQCFKCFTMFYMCFMMFYYV